jgi:hypothetical protein
VGATDAIVRERFFEAEETPSRCSIYGRVAAILKRPIAVIVYDDTECRYNDEATIYGCLESSSPQDYGLMKIDELLKYLGRRRTAKVSPISLLEFKDHQYKPWIRREDLPDIAFLDEDEVFEGGEPGQFGTPIGTPSPSPIPESYPTSGTPDREWQDLYPPARPRRKELKNPPKQPKQGNPWDLIVWDMKPAKAAKKG